MKKQILSKAHLLEKIHTNTTAKRWYIDYFLYNQAGELERIRLWVTAAQKLREKHFQMLLSEVRQIIRDGGYLDDGDQTTIDFGRLTFIEACVYLLNERNGSVATHGKSVLAKHDSQNCQLSLNTYRIYTHMIDCMQTWLESQSLSNLLLQDFTRQRATSYFQWAKEIKRFSPATLTTNKAFLRSVFNYFIDYHDLPVRNPLKVIKIRVPESEAHKPYTQEQLNAMRQWCDQQGRSELWLFFSLVYFAFIRPFKEALFLKRKHIGKSQILIVAENAKNKRSMPVRIVQELEDLIQHHKLREGDREEYIFSKDMRPGYHAPTVGTVKKMFASMHKQLNLPEKCSIYSLKSTGAIDHYRKHNNVLELKNMMRHSSLNTTAIYLRRYETVVWGE